jgi:hypothetical protein
MFEYLYQQLEEGLGEEGKENEIEISRVCQTTGRIGSAAEHFEDWKIDAICDEFGYIGAHATLARFKSDAQMPVLKALIQELDDV